MRSVESSSTASHFAGIVFTSMPFSSHLLSRQQHCLIADRLLPQADPRNAPKSLQQLRETRGRPLSFSQLYQNQQYKNARQKFDVLPKHSTPAKILLPSKPHSPRRTLPPSNKGGRYSLALRKGVSHSSVATPG